MRIQQAETVLDGNAAGGALSELFALDVTAAEFICEGCGATDAIGAARLYGGAMGAVIRCAHCATVVLRIAHTARGIFLDLRGARCLHVRTNGA